MTDRIRIAMWSGPRNISTAMMRAWENRADCCVVDEPFYACYLAATGIEHPMREEVLASQPTRWADVVAGLTAPLPAGVTIQYQKHMSHHMVGPLDDGWLAGLRHAFLIRDPAEMVASYARKRESVTAGDLGLEKEVELYERVIAVTGREPPVIEASDVIRSPELVLRRLCDALGVPFSSQMLSWPAGLRPSDGVWASHWYESVAQSTGFGRSTPSAVELTEAQQRVVDACRPHYEFLRRRKLGG